MGVEPEEVEERQKEREKEAVQVEKQAVEQKSQAMEILERSEMGEEGKKAGTTWVLRALLWKSFTLKRKRLLSSCCEFLIPILFLSMIAALKTLTDLETTPDGWSTTLGFCPYTLEEGSDTAGVGCSLPFNSFYKESISFEVLNFFFDINEPNRSARLFFYHSGDDREIQAIEDFINFVEFNGTAESGKVDGFRNHTSIRGSGSNRELEEYIKEAGYGDPFDEDSPEVLAAIGFLEMDFENAQFDYSLRLSSTAFGLFSVPSTASDPVNVLQKRIDFVSGSANVYMSDGFVALQQMIDSFIIAKTGEEYTQFPMFQNEDIREERKLFQPGTIHAAAFPIQEFTFDTFFDLVQDLIPMIFVIVYLMPVSQIVAVIVLEKEVRAREMMRIMGVSDFMIILSWYLTYATFFFVLSLLMTVICGVIFPSSAAAGGGFAGSLFLIFLLFGATTIAFCFVISTLFQRAFNGVVASLMLFIVLFFVFYAFSSSPEIGRAHV